jgi:hypothetical protein
VWLHWCAYRGIVTVVWLHWCACRKIVRAVSSVLDRASVRKVVIAKDRAIVTVKVVIRVVRRAVITAVS